MKVVYGVVLCCACIAYAGPEGRNSAAFMRSVSGKILPIVTFGLPDKKTKSNIARKGSEGQIERPAGQLKEEQKKSLRTKIMQIINKH
jgi:hypothetical protein